jgi:hypothetical protein
MDIHYTPFLFYNVTFLLHGYESWRVVQGEEYKFREFESKELTISGLNQA